MSTISELIFRGGKHYLSSPYGPRKVLSTSAGSTSSFHSGADYATYGEKLPQYAIADGKVTSCGKDSAANAYALYVWVEYPALKIRMLHYHLDSIKVKKGQTVKAGTLLGYTGKTGRSTGIHLHLGMKRIGGSKYIDPEKWSAEEYPKLTQPAGYKTGDYKVKVDLLHVRIGAGTDYKTKKFNDLTPSVRTKIMTLAGKKVDGYVKGLTFTVYEVRENGKYTWGRTPSGWVALNYCERI